MFDFTAWAALMYGMSFILSRSIEGSVPQPVALAANSRLESFEETVKDLQSYLLDTVPGLVPDHGADAAVVDRGVGIRVEKGRLKDRGRDGDLTCRWSRRSRR